MYKVFFNDRIVFLTDDANKTGVQNTARIFHCTGNDLPEKEIESFAKQKKVDTLIITGNNTQTLLRDFSGLFENVEAAGGLVRNNNSEILLIFRNGKWDLPKGKINPGEKPEAAALREITEECGITGQKLLRKLTNTYHSYTVKNRNFLKKTEWFEFFYEGSEILCPQTEEGITKAAWLKPNNMEAALSNTWASLIDVFAAAGLK